MNSRQAKGLNPTDVPNVTAANVVMDDSLYKLVLLSKNRRSDTGLLKVFELVPLRPRFPGFIGRWDRKADKLDVDITGVSKAIMQRFRQGCSGYSGHHSLRSTDLGRIFHVRILIPHGLIFEGNIQFSLGYENTGTGTICLGGKAQARFVPADRLEEP